jgi:uncharacterized protein (DUF488 family)
MAQKTLWTIGHSNRALADFLSLLTENNIQSLADVRRFPGSRRHPQFSKETLSQALADSGITYFHFTDLGGRRSKRCENSPNNAWRVAAFAAYADYMLTDEFKTAFEELRAVAERLPTCVMCAEALPWQCHRRLIADQFVAENWEVKDIVGPNKSTPHALPDFAVVDSGRVTYPGRPRPLFDK